MTDQKDRIEDPEAELDMPKLIKFVEHAVAGIAEKIREYPSSPYTNEQTLSLNNVLQALETARRIQHNEEKHSIEMSKLGGRRRMGR